MSQEIERKYLVKKDICAVLVRFYPAKWNSIKIYELEQAYVVNEDDCEIRVRMQDHSNCYLTLKIGTGLSRTEHEVYIYENQYLQLAKNKPKIRKFRHVVDRWELDVFMDDHHGVVLAEIKLTSEDEVVEFPDWLGPHIIKEVTFDESYKNKNLVKRI